MSSVEDPTRSTVEEVRYEKKPATRSAVGVAFTLAVLAAVWVIFGHLILIAPLGLSEEYLRVDVPVDLVLALLTAVLVFFLVRRELLWRERLQTDLRLSQKALERLLRERTQRVEEMSAEATGKAQELEAAHLELGLRARELAALLDVSLSLSSNLHSRPLLETLLDQLKIMIDYTGAAVFTRDDGAVTLIAYRGPVRPERVLGTHFQLTDAPGIQEAIQRGEPVIVGDIYDQDSQIKQIVSLVVPEIMETLRASHAWMAVPMMIKDRAIGVLWLDHVEPGFFTQRHAQLAGAIAIIAAIALENARLYEEAQRFARLEERQRMAMELHDSVSQALYGIALAAHAALEQITRAPAKLDETLNYILHLAQAAVGEMRALVLELHPESLEQTDLVAVLSRMAESARSRREIDVKLDLCDEPDLPMASKEMLHRIAQEALQNVIKHARANAASIRLAREDTWIVLEIRDNGVGFDGAARYPGHLGLQSMRERAMKLGGSLEIESTPADGSLVRARIPVEILPNAAHTASPA